ncbi:hypothetical protein [Pseudarthrobacter sp. H2]|uniref:hypothetical protein n=1 Tax=Pseudarthrobacter sp. H2 TaxID=3418415 RepID=UPI003CEAAB63
MSPPGRAGNPVPCPSVARMGRTLKRSRTGPGVLQFSARYLHYGEPGKIQGSDLDSALQRNSGWR